MNALSSDAISTAASFAELLQTLRRDRRLTQEDLSECAGVAVRTISDLERGISARPRPHTARRLADALELNGRERAFFLATARGERSPASRLPAKPMHGARRSDRQQDLPTPASRFIGRAAELQGIERLLLDEHVRLLTLTGPGGVGKTRLAIEAAYRARASFADGVAFVSLASVPDDGAVRSAVARSLHGLEATEQLGTEPLPAMVGMRELLLVLDNFEHLMDAADLVAELLAGCPRLTVLVTSRVLLRIDGEYQYPVPPLTVPPVGPTTMSALAACDATALFIERARAIIPGFALTTDNAATITAICRRLEGLPLALELAAARLNVLSAGMLLDGLSGGLDMLSHGRRDAPRRHQTMSAAIEWSYRLLTPEEQSVLARLSVFSGGCTLAAAQAVCGGETLAAIESLAESSLLQRADTRGAGPRYTMLELVREFSLGELTRRGEVDLVRRTHAEYFVRFVEEIDADLTLRPANGETTASGVQLIDGEYGNLVSALTWLCAHEEGALAVRLLAALRRPWSGLGLYGQLARWVNAVLPFVAAAPALAQGGALLAAAGAARTVEERGRWIEAAIAVYRQLGDEELLLRGLVSAASILVYGPHYTPDEPMLERGEQIFTEALALARHTGDLVSGAAALRGLAVIVQHLHRDVPRAERLLDESLELERRARHWTGIADSLVGMASLALYTGDLDRAAERLAAAHPTFAAEGHQTQLQFVHGSAGMIALCRDDWEGVERALRAMWELTVPEDVRPFSRFCCALAAAVAAARRDDIRAATLFGASDGPAEIFRDPHPVRDRLASLRDAVRSRLGDARWHEAQTAGRSLSPLRALAYAAEGDVIVPGTTPAG